MARLIRVHFCLLVSTATLLAPRDSFAAQQASKPAKRHLTIEDYYRIQTVGNPQISPDGKWVAFTVSTRIEEDNSTRTEAYIVPADASARPRRVLHYGRDISNPAWTGDNQLQYTADRQQWKVDPENASATPVNAENLPDGTVLSPDGKWLALA